MTGDSGGRYSEQRDGNLSALIKHIREDGPAETPAQRSKRPAPAPPPVPLIEAPPEPLVSRTPPAGPTRGRSRLAMGWKRLAMAVVGGAVVALAVTIGLWLDHPEPSLPASATEHPVASKVPELADLRAELRQLAASVAAIQRRMEGLAQDSQITTGEVKQLIAQGVKANGDRIDQLQASVERTQRAQSELQVLADRIENIGDRGSQANASRLARLQPADSDAVDADLEDGAAKLAVGSAGAREEASRTTSSAGPASPGEGDAHGAAGAAVGQTATTAAAAPHAAKQPPDVEPAAAVAPAGVHPARRRPAISRAAAAPEPEPSAAGSSSEEAAAPAGAQGAHWAINLVALTSREKAEAAQAAYKDEGVFADVVALRRSGSRVTLYGVSIPGFSSRAEAAAFAPKVKAKLGVREVWIFRR
jgi:hypothetical protein